MKKTFTLFLLLFVLISSETKAQIVTRIVASSPFQDSLWVIDTTNLQVLRRIGPTPSSGGSFTGMNSLAKNPVSGSIYVINKQSAVTGRVLGKLNTITGLVTIVGNLGDNFSSICFTSDQKLYGTTGDGATIPETLYQIDTATAAKRMVKTLGNGADGEIICWNTADNLFYHWSGNGTIVYEKFDTITGPYNFTNVPIIGATSGETFGAACIGPNKFITSNIGSAFNRFYANGTVTAQFGSFPDDLRGLAIIDCSRAISGVPQFCTGGNTTLTAVSGAAGTIYQWFKDGVIMPSETSQIISINTPGHYNVIIGDACGTDSSGTGVNVIENPFPVVNLGLDQTTCATPVTLDAQNAGSTYFWSDMSTAQTLTANVSGTYSVIVTDANNCSASSSVNITINPLPTVDLGPDAASCATPVVLDAQNAGSSFLWNDGTTTQTLSAATTGTYSVTVTDINGCVNNDAIVITINPLPVVNLGPDQTTCGTPVVLDAGNPGANYMWCDGSTGQTTTFVTSGTCAVIVTDANGCLNSDTIVVTINTPPVVTISSSDDTICSGSVSLTGSPVGGTFSGTGVSGSTFTSPGAGYYEIYYNYTDANGCSGTDSLLITVGPVTNIGVTASSNTVCVDDAPVMLIPSPMGGTLSGTGVSGNTFDPSVAGSGNHIISYTYTNAYGCTGTTTTQITVNACTGIIEHSVTNGTSVFPNPTDGNVQISVNANSAVTIFNALGENVMAIQLTEGNHQVDLTGLPEGIYFVRTQNVNGVSTSRLVINR